MRKVFINSIDDINRKFDQNCSVLAFGNFDGLHLGHKLIMNTVSILAKSFVIDASILTFDPHPVEFLDNKKNYKICSIDQKIELIESQGIDNLYVMNFNKNFSMLKPSFFIEKIISDLCKAHHVVTGSSCTFGEKGLGDFTMLNEFGDIYGYGITRLKNQDSISSSMIRRLISQGKVGDLKHVLGRNYSIKGKVKKGFQLGRKIGYPTINISVDGLILPKLGIYTSKVFILGAWYNGLFSIGTNPTFNHGENVKAEMYIFDFDYYVYGEIVEIELLDFIRSEIRFLNHFDLIAQMKKDVIYAQNYFKQI